MVMDMDEAKNFINGPKIFFFFQIDLFRSTYLVLEHLFTSFLLKKKFQHQAVASCLVCGS